MSEEPEDFVRSDGGRRPTGCRPEWFDDAKHRLTPGGIEEADTGVLLDGDGEPQSAAVRAQRERLAAEAKADAAPRAARAGRKAATETTSTEEK